MQEIDVLYLYEYVARELDVACAVKAIAEQHYPRPVTPLADFRSAVQRVLTDIPEHLHIIKDESVREWIINSDVVVTSYSTSLKDFIDGTARYGLDALYEVYRVKRPLWRFGLEPKQVAAFLEQYAWKELEQVGSQEYTLRYLKPAGRAIPVTEIERAVYAEKL